MPRTEEDYNRIMEVIKDSTNFEIAMLFLMYSELNLKQLTKMISKSKSTVHRHLKKLIEHRFLKEIREEERGNFKTKIYSINKETWKSLTQLAAVDFQSLDDPKKAEIYRKIIDILNTNIIYVYNSLKMLQEFLQRIKESETQDILNFMESHELYLNMNFLSKSEYTKYLGFLQDFNLKFVKMMTEEENKNPEAEKPYLAASCIIPLKKFFEN